MVSAFEDLCIVEGKRLLDGSYLFTRSYARGFKTPFSPGCLRV